MKIFNTELTNLEIGLIILSIVLLFYGRTLTIKKEGMCGCSSIVSYAHSDKMPIISLPESPKNQENFEHQIEDVIIPESAYDNMWSSNEGRSNCNSGGAPCSCSGGASSRPYVGSGDVPLCSRKIKHYRSIPGIL